MQALEKCYIRLCHRAELRSALGVPAPRHPHAPAATLPAAVAHASNSATGTVAEPASVTSISHQRHGHVPGHSSSPDLMFQLSQDLSSSLRARTPAETESASTAVDVDDSAGACLAASDLRTEQGQNYSLGSDKRFGLSQIDFCCFHSPFHKMVRKAFARLKHIDHLRCHIASDEATAGQVLTGCDSAQQPGQQQCDDRSTQLPSQAGPDELQRLHPIQPSQAAEHADRSQLSGTAECQQSQTQAAASQQAQQRQAGQPPDHSQHHRHDPQQQHSSEGSCLQNQEAAQPHGPASRWHEQQAAEGENLRQQLAASMSDRGLERRLVEDSSEEFEVKVQPGCMAGIQLGNSYSGQHV